MKRLLVLMGCVLAACSTQVTSLSGVNPAELNKSSFLLLTYDQDIGIDQSCYFNFENLKDGSEFMVYPSEKTPGVLLFNVPPGEYELDQVGCSKFKLPIAFRYKMTVFGTGVFYGSHLSLVQTENIKKVIMSLQIDKKEKFALETLQKVNIDLSSGAIYSAYTNKRIKPENFSHPSRRGISYQTVIEQGEGQIDYGNPDTDECFTEENKHNPLFMGEYQAEATYQKGKLIDQMMKVKSSTASKEHLDCVYKALSEFRPKTSKKIIYTLRY